MVYLQRCLVVTWLVARETAAIWAHVLCTPYNLTLHQLTVSLYSIYSKAVKLAIGVPVHTSTNKSYAKAGMISLSEQRKLTVLKYVTRSLAVINSVTEETFIDSNKDYPQRAHNIPSIQPNIPSIQPIRNCINDLINEYNIDITSIPILPASPQMPQWEHINAKFDTDYTDLKKSESTNISVIEVRERLNNDKKIILRF